MSKVMGIKEAIDRLVPNGSVVGLGGQNIGRCAMAAVHEIIRQGKHDLTLVGCNLSISMDILVGAGLVRRCESGSGNLERFGTTFCWRRKVERGELEVEDFSHLGMVSRFLAGEMGLPFMPIKSLLGSDILAQSAPSTTKKCEIIDNPWNPGESVALLPALNPDIAIVHAQKSDAMGNIIIEGFTSHEPEMIRSSTHTIVTCEEIIDDREIRSDPERTTIPHIYVNAVVHQPWGAYPTSTYRYYDYDAEHLRYYQECARTGGAQLVDYLDTFVFGCDSFQDYLDRAAGQERLSQLQEAMRHRCGDKPNV
ncbi:MAG: CoA transferase subunit A [Acidiferrobacterales bacterium]